MIRCVVITNTTDVHVDAEVNCIFCFFNIPDKFVWNMYMYAWNIVDWT